MPWHRSTTVKLFEALSTTESRGSAEVLLEKYVRWTEDTYSDSGSIVDSLARKDMHVLTEATEAQ